MAGKGVSRDGLGRFEALQVLKKGDSDIIVTLSCPAYQNSDIIVTLG